MFIHKQKSSGASDGVPALVDGTNVRTYSDIMCYNCNSPGYIAYYCPHSDYITQGINLFTLLHMGVVFTHHDNRDTIPLTWIMIDTCSTDSVTKNL